MIWRWAIDRLSEGQLLLIPGSNDVMAENLEPDLTVPICGFVAPLMFRRLPAAPANGLTALAKGATLEEPPIEFDFSISLD